jgi:amino acid adenylation domain-containing protein
MDAFPLTPSGKLDRKALPAPEGGAFVTRAFEAPAGPVEEALAAIWAEVVGVERVGRQDHFFEMGGHSLLAVRVVSRVRQALGMEVALGDLFLRPVLADFARGLETAGRVELPPIERAEREGGVPLSFAQQRLWFVDQLGSAGRAYHIPKSLRLRGTLHRSALIRALDRIVARHESLRTVFHTAGGEPVQVVAAEGRFRLLDHDLCGHLDAEAELRRLMAEEAGAPFDLRNGPLIRGRLVRLAADDHVLLVTMHHIVSDGWSMEVVIGEMGALYGAFSRGEADPLPPLPVQYADYAAWQRKWVEGEVLARQSDYWKRTLAGAPELLALPADRPRPARQDYAGGMVEMELDEELTASLKALGQRHGTTLFMTLLAGWSAVLARLSGSDDLVIGTPTANRGRREIEGLVGFFVNTLALRVELGGSPTVAELLARVKARALEAQDHQDIPFEQVVELVQPLRTLAHAPLYQALFAWQGSRGGLELPGLKLEPVGGLAHATAKIDLSLTLHEAGGRISGGAIYATSLFDRGTVERWLGYLRTVLAAMAADERQPVDRLPLLPPAERRQVVEEWNATHADLPSGACIHELFEAQAERAPDAVAVTYGERSLTYGELNARSNRLAHYLRGQGVGPDRRVAVCVERGLEMVVGLMATLKAGGAYVPLDPGYPADRLRYMLRDSAPVAVLTQAHLAGMFAGCGVPVIGNDPAAWATLPESNPGRGGLTPEHAAYVIYTSGSTGQPKGVVNPHRGVVNMLGWAQETWGLEAGEAVLQRMSFSFDVSVRELFWPLAVGARMVVARAERNNDPDYLAETIRTENVGTLHLVPSLLQLLLEHPEMEGRTPLRRVMCGGEALPPSLVKRFHERLPHATLYQMYGPTETTVAVTAHPCGADEGRERVPLGRPVANTRIYVLDARGEPVPAGVAGELYVGGAQVARGYLDRPALTAERFVPDPFAGEPGARMYRTGDLGRWLADGRLEFVGRNDDQVKVRGFRIELGEIENVLASHPAVREAVTIVREDAPGDRRLVAYLAGAGEVTAEALRAHAAGRLPEHMVPAAYVSLAELPLTPNGKVDRKALPAPEGAAFATRGYQAPEGETEEALAAIWRGLLGVERVGRNDHFFELGGHSLLATRLVLRVREEMEVEMSLREVFEMPVLSGLAEHLLLVQLAQFDPEELARLAETM